MDLLSPPRWELYNRYGSGYTGDAGYSGRVIGLTSHWVIGIVPLGPRVKETKRTIRW